MNIHEGHLCGGTLTGKGGTCIGKYVVISRFCPNGSSECEIANDEKKAPAFVCQVHFQRSLKFSFKFFSPIYRHESNLINWWRLPPPKTNHSQVTQVSRFERDYYLEKRSAFIQLKLPILFCIGGPLNCRLHKNGPWVLAGEYQPFNSFHFKKSSNSNFASCALILPGITSFGSGCSSSGYHPDVYIRISYYIKWIVKTMSQNWRNNLFFVLNFC